MNDIEKMQDKIAKLLAKAERTDNVHEAETFSAAAEKLMLKLGIEEAEVRARMGDGSKPKDKVVTKHTAFLPPRFIRARIGIAFEVAVSMGACRAYIQKVGKNQRLAVVGYESDVDMALMLITSILLQADHAQAQWWKSYEGKAYMTANDKHLARRQFLFSYRTAVGKRIREFYQEAVAEATPGTALVLRDKMADVDAEFNKLKLRTGRSLRGGSADGASAGSAAGARANVGGRGVGGGRTAIGG